MGFPSCCRAVSVRLAEEGQGRTAYRAFEHVTIRSSGNAGYQLAGLGSSGQDVIYGGGALALIKACVTGDWGRLGVKEAMRLVVDATGLA